MATSIDSALTSPSITSARELLRDFRLTLGSLEQEITVRLWRYVGQGGVFFEQSHFVHAPGHGAPHETSRTWAEDEASALHQVIFKLTLYFDMALRQGHTPTGGWLVSNPRF